MGGVYAQIAQRTVPIGPSVMARNIGFLVKSVPFASQKAENHIRESIQSAKEVGARWVLALAYLDLGLLEKARGRKEEARRSITQRSSYLNKARWKSLSNRREKPLPP